MPQRVWQTGLLFVAFVASFAIYVYGEKLVDRANEQRQVSYRLADQLRQSSDDLTRMVRSYVATGNVAFKQSYQDILDIRDGVKRRPDGYENFFWYLALQTPDFARPEAGSGVPLLELMRMAGFTDEEFRQLNEAKSRSDTLTAREFEAMRLVEAAAPGDLEARAVAIGMLHDEAYHHAKAAIMNPIRDFNDLVEQRTLAAVQRAAAIAFALRLTFIALTLAVIVFLWLIYRETRVILGGSVQQVHERITRIGQGDFSLSAAPPDGGGDSVLAGLERMAAKLGALEGERARVTAELREKNEALERSNADLEQFAYVASHDLQTPLRNIVSYTQLLERRYKGRLDADADDFIGFIVTNTKKMTQLIFDLLEFSRASRQTEPLEPCSAGEAVAQALSNLGVDLENSGVEICVGDLPEVAAVPSHLVSLFQNLLGNSIKYRSPDRLARISVTAEPSTPGYWRFAVADNGIGIEAQYHDKVFEIFQRLNPAAETEGTGIGLTLCRRIVHRFGGTIRVGSVPGGGTTVFFTLRGV
ncbi:Signal transduction histidine kinase [Paramagnetospirillum caucaseum]|uniref:histidine kinase n=1 Tax=Paramagnetospirillum caucaseum TaxID=1244869 RepID=M3A5E2_9PROT|nr:Signal transduction histidine kinase [Paramagnetospirillum caucaseum]